MFATEVAGLWLSISKNGVLYYINQDFVQMPALYES